MKDHASIERWSHGIRSLFRRFEAAGRGQGWWDQDGPIIAAVSGGSDSMALLWLLRFRWKGKVIAAHLEHGFRQGTSLRDAGFVERICREWNTECHVEHLDIPSMKRRGETLEEAGRRERYSFLQRVASLAGAHFIATGHTSDDLVETVFLNLLRGTGVRGLRGIPWSRGKVVRPIISISREELRGLLLEASVPWMEDETNLDTKYFRNKIRHVFLPLLCKEGNSRFKNHLMDLSWEARELEAAREKQSQSMVAWCRRRQPFALRSWDLGLLRRMNDQEVQSIIAFEGRDLGLSTLSREKTLVLLGLIRRGDGRWRFQWERDLEICASGRTASLVDRKVFCTKGPDRVTIALQGKYGSFKWGQWRFEWRVAQGLPPALGFGSCRIPADGAGPVEILAAGTTEKGELPEGILPWWAIRIWPLVRFAGSSWIPLTAPDGSAMAGDGVKPGPSIQFRAMVNDKARKGEIEDGV